MITPTAFFKAKLVFLGVKVFSEITENTMLERLRYDRANCDASKVVSSDGFSSSILKFGQRDSYNQMMRGLIVTVDKIRRDLIS